jgi:ClpP class serine protease
MGLIDLLWLFVLAAALQPALRRRLLEAARRRLRERMELARATRVILLVHRQETMSLLGFPLMRFIDIQDSEEVIRAIRDTPADVAIDLVLHTPGGLALASLQIAHAVAGHPAPVTAYVPHYAMSGGTLIALAADHIVMSEHAALGPLDPQIGPYPAASILRAVARKEAKDVEDETLILADQAEMAIKQLRRCVVHLLEGRMTVELADYLAGELSEGNWTHDHPILPGQAQQLGLSVDTDMPRDVIEMMSLYPQPLRRVRSVEYGRREPSGNGEA